MNATLEQRAIQNTKGRVPKGFVAVECSYEYCHVSGKDLARVQVLVPIKLYKEIERAKQKINGIEYDSRLLEIYHKGKINGIGYRFYVSKHGDIFDKQDCYLAPTED